MTTLAPIHTEKLTVDQYYMLGEDPPGVRLELIDGEIIVTAGANRSHAEIIVALACLLETHNRKLKLGNFYLNTDVKFTSFTARRPDIAFYANSKLAQMKPDRLTLPPDLCIEVLSPSNADDDRINKFELYQTHGVGHYWILDPATRTAECFSLREAKFVLTHSGQNSDTVHFPPFPELAVPLAQLWGP